MAKINPLYEKALSVVTDDRILNPEVTVRRVRRMSTSSLIRLVRRTRHLLSK